MVPARRGHGRQDGGRTLRVLWTPPSSARKTKPIHTRSGNRRDPPWVYGHCRTRSGRAGVNPTPGGTPERSGPGGDRGVESVLPGAAPRGGESGRGPGMRLPESGPRVELSTAIWAPREGTPAARRRAAP
ncbi:hypothetical protein NDU88_006749 [Pleurodeles waltl]|uniref:Uncharacterized protein n=1 Tax=Pleurodeles waltl TaxID=8319 RepID=A0AAV7NYZ5_PLEWA|nr:hypothetical protein NDU88_006749 [Pleurodeles waltl]